MFSFPPIPPWDGMHPSVIHFPVALMFVAPIFIALALLWKKHTQMWLIAGALVMTLAAAGALVATSTGSAAEDFAENVPGAKAILEEHEELGEATRNFTLVLAVLLIVVSLAILRWGDKIPRALVVGFGIVYLFANGAGILVAANTAHQGGRLVHEVGVRARLSANASTPAVPTAEHPAAKKHD